MPFRCCWVCRVSPAETFMLVFCTTSTSQYQCWLKKYTILKYRHFGSTFCLLSLYIPCVILHSFLFGVSIKRAKNSYIVLGSLGKHANSTWWQAGFFYNGSRIWSFSIAGSLRFHEAGGMACMATSVWALSTRKRYHVGGATDRPSSSRAGEESREHSSHVCPVSGGRQEVPNGSWQV